MVGFGFLPFLIDTHFDARGRIGRLISGLYQLKMSLGIGVDESTAIFYDQGVGTIYGKGGVFIVDIRKA